MSILANRTLPRGTRISHLPTFGVSTRGVKEVQEALNMLPKRLADRVIRNAVHAGARYMVKKIKERAPVGERRRGAVKRFRKTGNKRHASYLRRNSLKNSIVAVRRNPRGVPVFRSNVVIRAPHWHLVEYGTAKRFLKTAEPVILPGGFKLVRSTGRVSPQPFVEPAFRMHGEDASKVVREELRKRMNVEVAKLKTRTPIRGRAA